MATVTAITAARAIAIENALIESGEFNAELELILEKVGGGTITITNLAEMIGEALAILQPALYIIESNTVTDDDHTLLLSDLGKSVDMNSDDDHDLIIPPNEDVDFPLGAVVEATRIGTGAVSVVPGAGVTIPNRIQPAGTATRTITNRMDSISLRQRAIDEWVLVGDIE